MSLPGIDESRLGRAGAASEAGRVAGTMRAGEQR